MKYSIDFLMRLLLLLLLGLIFAVVYCCFLNRCNFDFCKCSALPFVIPSNVEPFDNDRVEPAPEPSTGDVQILLEWNNYNDLDLHCVDPSGEEIYFSNRVSRTGGQLEIDMNAGGRENRNPIENIYWQTGQAPSGTYRIYINYYDKHDVTDETPYKITIIYGSKEEIFRGTIRSTDPKRHIHTFSFNR